MLISLAGNVACCLAAEVCAHASAHAGSRACTSVCRGPWWGGTAICLHAGGGYVYAKEKLVGWGKRLVNSGSQRLSSLRLERLSAAHGEALGHATSSLCIYARGNRRLIGKGFYVGQRRMLQCAGAWSREDAVQQIFVSSRDQRCVCLCGCVGGRDYIHNGVRMRREGSGCQCGVGNKKILCFSVLITWVFIWMIWGCCLFEMQIVPLEQFMLLIPLDCSLKGMHLGCPYAAHLPWKGPKPYKKK